MCLIRTRNELDEEVNIPARVISQRVPQQRRSRSRQSRRRSRSRSRSSSASRRGGRSQAVSYPPAQYSLPPPPPRSVHESIEIDRRRVSEIPLAAAPTRSPRQNASVVTVHVDRSPRASRGDQVAVVRPREYVREREDEGPSYRYVKPGRESMRSRREEEEEEERGYGRSSRRSGSLTYAVNPRTSTASHRSTRERIVVQDYDGRRREYYK